MRKTIDAPDVPTLEKDLLAITDELETYLVASIKDGISDWQKILLVLVKLRKIIEEGDSLWHKIMRWILKWLGIKKKKPEESLVAWSKKELDDHVRRDIATLR